MKLDIPTSVPIPYTVRDRIVAANPDVPLEEAVLKVLARGADQPLDAAAILLTGEDLQTLVDLLPVGATRTAATLVAGIQRLADVRIGTIKVPFTVGQQDELKERARRSGKSVQQETEAVVRGMHEQFFNQPLGV